MAFLPIINILAEVMCLLGRYIHCLNNYKLKVVILKFSDGEPFDIWRLKFLAKMDLKNSIQYF